MFVRKLKKTREGKLKDGNSKEKSITFKNA